MTVAVPQLKNIALGEGVYYANYGETDEFALGASQGGGSFIYAPEFKTVEFDGSRGDTKGTKRIVRSQTQVKVKMLELFDKTKLEKIIPTASSGTTTIKTVTYDSLTVSETLADGDYLKNITFIGKKGDGSDFGFIIYNALSEGGLEAVLEGGTEVVPEITFTAHRDSTTPETAPFKILFEQAAE